MERFNAIIYAPIALVAIFALRGISPILAKNLKPPSTEVIVRPVDGAQLDNMVIDEIAKNPNVQGRIQVEHLATYVCLTNLKINRVTILNQLNQELAKKALADKTEPSIISNDTTLTTRAIIGTRIADRLALDSKSQIPGENFGYSQCAVKVPGTLVFGDSFVVRVGKFPKPEVSEKD